ncbi:MAG: hypothetical protein ACRC92_27490 [Peptostreptococcaceae bacterium]
MKIKIEHISNVLNKSKVILETRLTQGKDVKTIYEAVLTTDESIGEGFVGYAIDGYNHISGKEISVANVVTKEELNIMIAKWNIQF